jgi:two-component system nitrogen regulation sensor histidine kinase NtrY
MMNEHKVGHIQRELRVTVEGESKPLLLHLSILKNQAGEEIGKLAVFDDLTPIIQAQRAAAWREVARRIAHEIKNPLTPIKLSAERLLRKFGDQIQDPAFHECARMIIQQTDELRSMVNEFSQFARLPEIKVREGQLNDVISEALLLYEHSTPGIKLVKVLDKNLPPFLFDPEQIKRVMTNLIENAIAACEGIENCKIEVKTEWISDLGLVRVRVSDTGVGVSATAKTQIFDPYYTTKKEGSGLGLAIVKRIIEDHRGFIRVLDNEPRGAQILFELPLS